jgi:adenosylhomocysteine nucleosidase
MNHNVDGILNVGGTMSVTDSAVGSNAIKTTVISGTTEARESESGAVGIITITAKETDAVRQVLELQDTRRGGLHFYSGEMGTVPVIATRALGQGQRSTMAAYENLMNCFQPSTVVLTGIGGGFHPDLSTGDVVVSTQVVYYDLRKETPKGTVPRGEQLIAPASVGHTVNRFFTDHDPPVLPITDPFGTERPVTVHSGPIGSGDAVIADRDAWQLAFLRSYNDKILALDMEAGGLSLACHERSARSGRQHQWVVVRGISDDASQAKNDAFQRLAAWHAAHVLRNLIPYLAQ